MSTRLKCVFFVFAGAVFSTLLYFLTLEEKRGLGGSEVVEMVGNEVVCEKDPERYSLALVDALETKTPSEIFRLTEEGDGCSNYLAGLLSYGQLNDVPIEYSPNDVVRYMEEAWRKGVIDAGFRLFEIYYFGRSVEENKDKALVYLMLSGEMGFILSQRTLGTAYSGRGKYDILDVDLPKAREWFERSASQGGIISAINLGGMYHQGDGGEKNDQKALYWILKSRELPYGNEFLAFRGLARFYEKGIGTDIDLVQAYKYYDLLSPGSAPDKARLEEQMTPEQINEAIRLSRQWQEEHNTFVPSYYGLEYQEDGTFQ